MKILILMIGMLLGVCCCAKEYSRVVGGNLYPDNPQIEVLERQANHGLDCMCAGCRQARDAVYRASCSKGDVPAKKGGKDPLWTPAPNNSTIPVKIDHPEKLIPAGKRSISLSVNDLLDAIETSNRKAGIDTGVAGHFSGKSVSLATSSTHVKVKAKISGTLSATLPCIKTPCAALYALLERGDGSRLLLGYANSDPTGKTVWHRMTGAHDARNESIDGPEVDKKHWRNFRFDDISGWRFWKKEGYALLCYRLELWYDGNVITQYDSATETRLQKLGLPVDWYVKDKYPQKIAWEY